MIRELLDYDPLTGVLTWRERPVRPGMERADKGWNTRFVGKPAGRPGTHGHLYISLAVALYVNKNFAAHRVAWAHYYGEWPTFAIDHKNRDPSDNQIDNLRPATQTQNLQNASKRSDNKSGYKGVCWSTRHRKWRAYIQHDGKHHTLGYFEDKADAAEARRKAAVSAFGEFATEQAVAETPKS